MVKNTTHSQNSSAKSETPKAEVSLSDSGFGFHKKTDLDDVLIRAADDMGLNIQEIAHMVMKYREFFILATSAYLRVVLNNREFAKETAVTGLYKGRDVVFDMMADYVSQWKANKEEFVRSNDICK